MCRNIKKLRYPDRVSSDEELRLAALQFVRKVSGYRVPSGVNAAAFNAAVENVAIATRGLFDHLEARTAGAAAGHLAGTGVDSPDRAMASNS